MKWKEVKKGDEGVVEIRDKVVKMKTEMEVGRKGRGECNWRNREAEQVERERERQLQVS